MIVRGLIQVSTRFLPGLRGLLQAGGPLAHLRHGSLEVTSIRKHQVRAGNILFSKIHPVNAFGSVLALTSMQLCLPFGFCKDSSALPAPQLVFAPFCYEPGVG